MRHLSGQNFMFMLSIIVGLIAGLVGVLLKTLVHYIIYLVNKGFELGLPRYLYFAYPMVGMLLCIAYVVYVNRNRLGHGISNVLYNIARKGSRMEPDKMYSHMLTSALTVGFGGSVGLEAPIVTTGAAIGSNIGQFLHLNYKKRTLLLGCGAAAGLAAIFNAPITGVIFTMEVLLLDLSIPSFIPLLLAATAATVVSQFLLGDEILFALNLDDKFQLVHLPYYILLGVATGFVSLYFTRVTRLVEKAFDKLKGRFRKGIVGGAILGLLIFLFPQLYGEGYHALKDLLSGNTDGFLRLNAPFGSMIGGHSLLLVTLALVLLKVFASSVTLAGGGNGGVFAPSLFTGGIFGYFFAEAINSTGFLPNISPANFGVAGIAGLMSGVMHAPLTAIFLVMRITNSYDLMLPLMIVAALAYATVRYFDRYSLYAVGLAEKGDLINRDKDKSVLSSLRIEKLIEKDLLTVLPSYTLGTLVRKISVSHRNIFPVINVESTMVGIITLDDIRNIMFDHNLYESTLVSDIMHDPPSIIDFDDDMETVMDKFDSTGAWNLPVTKTGKYVGMVSKSKMFSIYRSRLIRQGNG